MAERLSDELLRLAQKAVPANPDARKSPGRFNQHPSIFPNRYLEVLWELALEHFPPHEAQT
jgi:hypothetical protein